MLFTAAIAVLLVARARLVPKSFGELGHYRADALVVNAARPVRYAGLEVCAGCHDDEAAKKAASYHRTLTCEGCHGPASDHAEDPSEKKPVIPRERKDCLRCHEYRFSRPTGFPQVIENLHNPMQPCMNCHNPHDPTPPHVPGTCGACHGAIARTKAVSPHHGVDCEVCHQAAAEHRINPRASPPSKPRAREFCGRCHAPDAKSPANIPRVDIAAHGGRYLCWQCHYPHFPEAK